MQSIQSYAQQYWHLVVGALLVAILLRLLSKYCDGVCHGVVGADLRNKFVVITGGNTGIGKETALQMAQLGCHVFIGARDTKKSHQTVKEIISKTGNNNVEHAHLNLADKNSIENFAQAVPYQHIDYLINNAGVMAIPTRRLTVDGFEMQYGVNHLGHFYLTSLLWPKIKKSQFFRVINVSSLAHKKTHGFWKQPTLDFDNINYKKEYDAGQAYSRSKLYNVLFTRALAQRIDPKNGLTASLHPGVIKTELTREMKAPLSLALTLASPIWAIVGKSVFMGSQTTMFTALSDKVQNGCYYADCKKNTENSLVKKQNWDKLWEISETLLDKKFQI